MKVIRQDDFRECTFIPPLARDVSAESFWGCDNVAVRYKNHLYRPYQFDMLSEKLKKLSEHQM